MSGRFCPERAYQGTTLFADNSQADASRVVEVDMKGTVIWEYTVSDSLSGRSRRKDAIVMDVERLPNGNVLFNIQRIGIYEVDRSGKVVWSHLDSGVSHDADRLPNGNTLYVQGWASKGEAHVVKVDPRGKTVWSWDGLKQFDKPPYSNVESQGWIHANAATRMENGNTLVSLRNFKMVIEVKPDGDVGWSQEFPLERMPLADRLKRTAHPHDPEILASGNLLAALTGGNIVLEIDRRSGQLVWSWRHPDGPRSIAFMNESARAMSCTVEDRERPLCFLRTEDQLEGAFLPDAARNLLS